MEFLELVKERYSVRDFKEVKVEKEKLDKVLLAGNLAPTAKNLQPQRIYVIESDDGIKKVDELTHCRYKAKTVLLFTYDKDEEWKNSFEEGVHSGVEDVSIVATHMMLMAKDMGLDTCWCNAFPNTKAEELFNIPKNERVVLLMPIGYASDSAKPSPMHTAKKDIGMVVRYL